MWITCLFFWATLKNIRVNFLFSSNNSSKSGSINTFYWSMSMFGSTVLFVLLERLVLGS
jgi:hypothetical protein